MSYKKVLLALVSIMAIFSSAVFAESLLVEAEGFDSHGGWSLDQQFMQTMGSPYLLAHGMGKPVADAVTTVDFKSTGKYRMWVRTMDWVPGNWKSPGRFQVILDGLTVEKEFGTLAGWQWQDGGTVDVKNKSLQIKLHDLTGFDGRCDAIFFSNDPAVKPVNFDAADPSINRKWRNKLLGLPDTPPDGGRYDVIIVGGGIAGCAAALAAEERGLRVALVNDREALGGNASIEVRVGTGGVYGEGERILEKICSTDDKIADNARRNRIIREATGIKTFTPYRAYGVKMADGRIVSVDAVSTVTGKALRLRSDLFIDCTGDGWIGYWAGAEYRYGRESYTEFGEAWDKKISYPRRGYLTGDPLELWSPKKPDNRVMGSSLLWKSHDAKNKVSFPWEVPWAMNITKGVFAWHSVELDGGWTWEYSANDIHQIYDAEHIRDHLLRAIYSSFYKAKQQGKYAKRELSWVGYVSGKRESRRLMGDYIYTMKDMVNGTLFDDAVVQERRSIDLHFQRCREGDPDDFRSWALFRRVPRYYIPFRCLYSKDVDNLMMAGRCFSCSHVGLGGPRVMNTTGQMGIATGYAASLCIQHRTTPRGVYQNHIDELKKLIGVREGPRQVVIKIQPAGKARRTSDPERRENAISKLPDELNALKSVAVPRESYREPGTDFKFRISAPAVVYISVHQRGGYTPPASWKKTDMKLTWFPKWWKFPQEFTDVIYMKKFDAGVVEIPVHDGGDPDYGLPHLAFVKGANVKISEADDRD